MIKDSVELLLFKLEIKINYQLFNCQCGIYSVWKYLTFFRVLDPQKSRAPQEVHTLPSDNIHRKSKLKIKKFVVFESVICFNRRLTAFSTICLVYRASVASSSCPKSQTKGFILSGSGCTLQTSCLSGISPAKNGI